MRRNCSFTTFQHYIGYSSHYVHTFSMYRGKKGETELGYRETCSSTTATLVLLNARSTAPIHGVTIVRLHSPVDDEYDEYIQWKDERYVGVSSVNRSRVFRLKGETCVTARPPRLPEM